MPERDLESGHSSRLLRGLIWAGVLLAPVAAGIVLLGHSSASVRFAVLLVAVSVVLIGASVLVRHDPVLHRMHIEDRVAEEIEVLRADLRAEFGRLAAPAVVAPAQAALRTPDNGFAGGGRASVPPPTASAAVRPMPPAPAGREPGMTSGARAAASASIPRQRGAASVPPPRATASVRPGGQYAPVESLDADFGAGNGYADAAPNHQPPASGGNYGSARVNGYDGPGYDGPPSGDYGRRDYGYEAPSRRYDQPVQNHGQSYDPAGAGYDHGGQDYGQAQNGYEHAVEGYGGYPAEDYGDADAYGLAGGYDGPLPGSGDPTYRARRHRPSANDTNVGSLEDFAAYPGWDGEPAQGYGRRR